MTKIHENILLELGKIEREEQVRIVYACESGSRAWGFPSKDSDYDVRFIYVRRWNGIYRYLTKRCNRTPYKRSSRYKRLGFAQSA